MPTRQQSPSTLFRRAPAKQGRIRRWRAATLNWLNGLPVHAEEDFDSSSIKNGLQASHMQRGTMESIKYHIRPQNWFRSRSQGNVVANGLSSPEAVLEPSTADERPPLRIIQLPPEANLASANKLDDLTSATVTNEIRTAKYTLLTFLPKNLLEQMRRVANIYFVFIVILQCIPAVSNYSPVLAALPIVAIITVTAIKDAVEDWRRHQQDNKVNYSIALTLNRPEKELLVIVRDTRWRRFCNWVARWRDWILRAFLLLYLKAKRKPTVLGGKHRTLAKLPEGTVDWKETFWRDMRVGDIVLLRNNEMIPADILTLATSEPDGVCFVETKNLDGETNLKIRRSPYETEWVRGPEDAYNLKATVEVDLPNNNLYAFNGKLIIAKDFGEEPDGKEPFPEEQQPVTEVEAVQEDYEYGGVKSTDDLLEKDKATFAMWSGSAFVEPTVVPVSNDGLLLRGCIVRNTEYVIGVVAYTGAHTKLMLNSGGTPSKRTRIERQMNPQIILNFVLLLVICVACAVVQAQFSSASAEGNAPYWVSAFDGGLLTSSAFLGFLTFWSSLILFQTLVPISMYVTVEMVKTIQAFFINNDASMYHLETDRRAVPRAWNLADDLGQIEYLFSDKTGTLTQNVMEFRRCSIGGHIYGVMAPTPSTGRLSRTASGILAGAEDAERRFTELEGSMVIALQELLPYDYVPPGKFSFVDPLLYEHIRHDPDRRERILNFYLLLIVCHTVLIDRKDDDREPMDEIAEWKSAHNFRPHNLLFKAQSPDEAALVAAARDLGFVFLGRDKDLIFVSIMGTMETIRVLHVLEFSSDRKRMSTIIRRQDGRVLLLCKGADNVIFERLSGESLGSEEARTTQSHLEYFAEDGLRTLCLAHKVLKEDVYQQWLSKFSEASAAMHNRELLVDAVADEIERDLTLIGATAIEDRLQDGVPECIETLQLAGIKMWVLTGDKMETAINIGFSCRLLTKSMVLLVIRGASAEETVKQLRTAYEKIWSRYFCFGEHSGGWTFDRAASSSFAMIIDGGTLKYALDKSCRKLFVTLSSRCTAVICCRVSPLQKAKVVELVRRGKNVMTMAIGDGANDVSMIQAADVGVGIAGQEGMQAVMSSDYAIAQFRYLTRLLLVHGRWSYIRVAQVTLCSLYKNLAFVVLLFWYQFYCGFTAQYVYDYMYLLFFNVFFSILPLLILGSLDRDLGANYLVKTAPIYRLGIKQTSYSMKLFLVYLFDALFQSVVCFFIPMLTYRDTAIAFGGQPENQTLLGNAMALSIITCTNLYMALMTYSWVSAMFYGLALTILTVVGFLLVYSLLPGQALYGSWYNFLDPIFWSTIVLSIIVALAPRYFYMYVRATLRPNDLDIVREIERWHIGEADLARSIQALRKEQVETQRLGDMADDVIQMPPKALLRVTPKRLLALELPEEAHPTGGMAVALEPPPEPKSRGKFFRRSLALFNVRTERFERVRGFAFSQEDGMGEVVTRKRERPQAFGSVFLQAPEVALRRSRLSRAQIELPTPTAPGAVAQRGTRSQTHAYYTRRPSKLGSTIASP